ncbi:MAG: four helix bundle protein [Bacteroidota bacterium]
MHSNQKGIENLKLYQRLCKLRKETFELVKEFPTEERYRLADQLIRSTRKCPANIAEGYGRFHYKENLQYCRIARGSLYETIDHLGVAWECNYISIEQHTMIKNEITSLLKMTNSYINYLKSLIEEKPSKPIN